MTKLLNMDICAQCEKKFNSYEEYLDHTCGKTGFKPNTVEHLDATSGGKFSQQSLKARERGKARKNLKK